MATTDAGDRCLVDFWELIYPYRILILLGEIFAGGITALGFIILNVAILNILIYRLGRFFVPVVWPMISLSICALFEITAIYGWIAATSFATICALPCIFLEFLVFKMGMEVTSALAVNSVIIVIEFACIMIFKILFSLPIYQGNF